MMGGMVWLSICSAHREYESSCPRCRCGHDRQTVEELRRDLCARSGHMPAYHQGEWRCFRCEEPVPPPTPLTA